MPELTPLPIAVLLRRMFYEFRHQQQIFDLPSSKFWRESEKVDLSVRSHGKPAATPLGPAAGPHTQMAQNIVLAFLGGSRIMELKTIQINDRLTIPRPCIDATNVGYNVEFSQELRLEQSLEEYVKAWMLLHILEESEILGVPKRGGSEKGATPAAGHFYDCIFDLSCGYNLEGIASERVQWFIRSMMDASEEIERLRAQIPEEFAWARELNYDPHIVTTATLSTFHGCPPNEIEGIVEHLLKVNHLHVVVKMNPTMLGRERVEELLHDVMGYHEIQVNPQAFESGLQFEESIGLIRRLRRVGRSLGLQVGVKFSNTLEVLNHRDFFPKTEKVMYLSGQPLHPIGMELALRFREEYVRTADDAEDAAVPISFSAGVDKHNFADCVACGMVPITVCTDLLRVGGYGRQVDYLRALEERMVANNAGCIAEFICVTAKHAGSVEHCALQNHRSIVARVVKDDRYSRARNSLVPKRINSRLWVFDCIACDKCIPVCPNDANFTYDSPGVETPYKVYEVHNGDFHAVEEHIFAIRKAHQIANFGPFCNECGNCDTFCPEYGGPYVEKPTFFFAADQWQEWTTYDGFLILHHPEFDEIRGRIRQQVYILRIPKSTQGLSLSDACHIFEAPAGTVEIDPERVEPIRLLTAGQDNRLDLGIYLMLRTLLLGVLYSRTVNYVNAQFPDVLEKLDNVSA